MCEIKFTIKVTFGDGCEKPNLGEMVNFAKALDGDPTQVEAVYKISEEKAIYIKYKSEEAMHHALDFNAENLMFNYANGKAVSVRVSHAGEYIQYVRIHDLPPEVSDHELVNVLSKYGKVKRVVREKFPIELSFDAYTGVRGAYMDVKQEIPTSLHFCNRRGNIYYSGNKNRCFSCKQEGHRLDACPKRKLRKQQQNGENTYAGVVSGEVLSNDGTQQTETQHEEEVREENMAISTEETSEDESDSNVKNNVFYKIALKIKEKQDEEKEKKRLQESKEQRDSEKVKARKKFHK